VASSRLRWFAVWALIALWLAALAFDVGGDLAHLLLLAAIVLLVYELLAEPEPTER
jgi:hypothetical protein